MVQLKKKKGQTNSSLKTYSLLFQCRLQDFFHFIVLNGDNYLF